VFRHRTRHGGFSLTEVLMAAGILGVGMTMVASVFPVAVDQSRQSRDTTMAALSARSIAAVLRARRTTILRECRQTQDTSDPRDTTWLLDDVALRPELRCFNPHLFLYPADKTGTDIRDYDGNDLWDAGSYVPVVFATPMSTLVSNSRDESEGPWRITIVIYKARGRSPTEEMGYTRTEDIPIVAWNDSTYGGGEAGDYIMDFQPGRNNVRGEAYKVSRVAAGRDPDSVRDDSIYPVAALDNPDQPDRSGIIAADRDVGVDQRGDTPEWLALRGAVAVYHTILGD